MIALVDGDLVAYITAASAEKESKEIALLRCDRMMRDILETTQAESYKCFISGQNNFRYKVNKDYKANRKDTIDPKWRETCKDFLITEWNSSVTDSIEADDALGIEQVQLKDSSIICSIDKDLDCIPGLHYSWPIIRGGKVVREGKIYSITEEQAIKHFYKQMLIGDKADNIIGVSGIGTVRAGKLIDPLKTEIDMYQTVCDLYKDVERFDMNADCLWIQHNQDELFTHRDPWN